VPRDAIASSSPPAEAAAPAERALKPGRLRALLTSLVTLLAAAGLVAWAGRGVSLDELRAGLNGVAPAWVALPLALFAFSFFTADVLGFGLAWRRHLAPDVPWSHVRALVCGKQVLFAVVPVLTKLVGPLYFWRHWRIHPLRTFGTSELISACEIGAVMLLVTAAMLFTGVGIGPVLTSIVGAWWAAALVALLWLWSPRLQSALPRLRNMSLFYAWVRLKPRELSLQLGLRLAYQLAGVGCVWLLLAALGARLSFAQLLAFGPLLLLSGFLPVSMAGYGGPQGVAVALLADKWILMTRAQALAFSLVWSTGLLLIELGVGAMFVPALVRLLRAPRPAGEEHG